jgi:fermentation-respiration switch protein FrsA (DUF1100 family)
MTPSRRKRIAILLLGGVGLAMLLSFLEQSMVYYPEKDLQGDPSGAGLAFEDVHLETEDGLSIHGWWVPHEDARMAILFLHGNAGNISHRLGRIALFHDLGASILIGDYRGYGRSEGRPSERGLYRDADAMYRHLREERGIPPERIVIFGKSLGGAVAADLAARKEAAGVILESSFTSLPDMAREVIPLLPGKLMVRSRYDNLRKIPTVRMPILIIHGDEDRVVPFEMGQRLLDAAPEGTQFFPVPGADHNDVLEMGGRIYPERVRSFLARVTPPPGGDD